MNRKRSAPRATMGEKTVLRIDVLTIFPELFAPFRRCGVLGAALEKNLLTLEVHDLRRFAQDRRRTVDDIPYGGGPGMVMKPEPLVTAIETLRDGDDGAVTNKKQKTRRACGVADAARATLHTTARTKIRARATLAAGVRALRRH